MPILLLSLVAVDFRGGRVVELAVLGLGMDCICSHVTNGRGARVLVGSLLFLASMCIGVTWNQTADCRLDERRLISLALLLELHRLHQVLR